MSMLATFVQVEPGLLADPERIERLFAPELPAMFDPERMREAILSRGPQLLAATMDMHPQLRGQIEASLGRSQEALRGGEGGEALFALMRKRIDGRRTNGHPRLELDKAWHGVHYVLSGTVEPAESLLSQAVLGGTEVGEDFSGYGPARCFTVEQVGELAAALGAPETEREADERYDPERMNELQIYPFGWAEDLGARDWILGAFRRLRGFYAAAAADGCAIVTCLV
jgi:hypothetical protein